MSNDIEKSNWKKQLRNPNSTKKEFDRSYPERESGTYMHNRGEEELDMVLLKYFQPSDFRGRRCALDFGESPILIATTTIDKNPKSRWGTGDSILVFRWRQSFRLGRSTHSNRIPDSQALKLSSYSIYMYTSHVERTVLIGVLTHRTELWSFLTYSRGHV